MTQAGVCCASRTYDCEKTQCSKRGTTWQAGWLLNGVSGLAGAAASQRNGRPSSGGRKTTGLFESFDSTSPFKEDFFPAFFSHQSAIIVLSLRQRAHPSQPEPSKQKTSFFTRRSTSQPGRQDSSSARKLALFTDGGTDGATDRRHTRFDSLR